MKGLALAALVALWTEVMMTSSAPAQPAGPPSQATRILAIGTINPGVDVTSVRAILPAEAKATVKLYLAGQIDQWFSLWTAQYEIFFISNQCVVASDTKRCDDSPAEDSKLSVHIRLGLL